MVGSILSDRYEILERRGEGGMAIVYRARDRILGRRVAIKVLRPQYAADTDFVERFRREAQAAASLSHPNVVNIFDVGTDGDVHYIVMEYVEGRNLKEILREQGRLPVAKALDIAEGVCLALETAHEQGLIHRDIKPHNILVTRDGHVKVTDFGIARAASTATLTQTGTVIGSVHYLSPEQAIGRQVGVFSDIYSVGVLLYEMVTGKVPFDGESPVAVALKHLQSDPDSPRRACPDVPEALEKVILRAMAKEPSQRYGTIGEMLADLQRVRADRARTEPVAAASVTVVEPGPHPDHPGEATAGERTAHDPDEETTIVAQLPAEEEMKQALVGAGAAGLEATIVRASRTESEAGQADGTSPEEEDEQVPAKKKKRRSLAFRIVLGLVIFLSFTSGAVWAGLSFFDRLFPEDVVVPEVLGMTVEQARAVLEEHGLGLSIVREVNSDQPVNTIVRQLQDPGRTVKMGRQIEVHVSIGREIVEVPDLTMHSEREAMLRLVQWGLEVGEVTTEYRLDVPPNLVVAQDPAPHARVLRGTAVDLVFSTGAEPLPLVQVPDFRGQPLELAVQQVEELGLVVGETFGEEDPNFQPGQVTDQFPEPGAEVEVGSVVNFVYRPAAATQIGFVPSAGGQTATDETASDGDVIVQSLITIHVPPGPEQEVEIVIIDNISARRVYYGVHRGDARVTHMLKGRGAGAMYQVYIGGELRAQGLIAEAR